jgi:hypothetical protein
MKSPRTLAFILSISVLATLAAPTAARAQSDEAPFAGKPPTASFAPMAASSANFGGAGQWVLTVQTANDMSTAFSLRGGSGSYVNIHPALDTFLISNLSVGGALGFSHAGGVSTFGLGARAGYNLGIASQVSFWPTAGVFAAFATGNHMSSSGATLQIYAPFLYHPVPHVFAGIGPTFNLGLSGGNNQQYGLDFVLGGWL